MKDGMVAETGTYEQPMELKGECETTQYTSKCLRRLNLLCGFIPSVVDQVPGEP